MRPSQLAELGPTAVSLLGGYSTAGHTSKNPFVRRFQGMGSPLGGAGGYFIVSPSQKQLFAKWRKLLASTGLRYDFPFMTIAEIHAAIAG